MLMKRIDPSCLAGIKKRYKLHHIVMWCNNEDGQYIVSCGDSPDHTVQAALIANRIRESLGWPNMSFAVPPKISDVLADNKRLTEELRALRERKGVCDGGNEKQGLGGKESVRQPPPA